MMLNSKRPSGFGLRLGAASISTLPTPLLWGETLTSALKLPFSVSDESGKEVGSGVVGGEALSLAPGIYEVKVGARPGQNVKINPEEESILEIQ